MEVFREIYQYSIAKQMKRVGKWWDGLAHLCQELIRKRGRDGLTDPEMNSVDFVTFMSVVRKLSIGLPKKQSSKEEWRKVYECSTRATKDASAILGVEGESSCDKLADLEEFKVEKLTSLTRHVNTLIAFAHSPRLRPVFEYSMTISLVLGQSRAVILPTFRVAWQAMIEATCKEKRTWQPDYAMNFLAEFGEREQCGPLRVQVN